MATLLRTIDDRADWQQELARAFTDPQALLRHLGLPADEPGLRASEDFALRAPRPYVDRIRPGERDDPLLLQVLPRGEELAAAPGFGPDPLVEHEGAMPGLLRKYRSRALVILRGGCAVNCRYCFRRHFPYGDHALGEAELGRIVEGVAADPEIDEVILSGGDPLIARDEALAAVVAAFEAVPRLVRLRIHTRLPVVIPSRVTPGLVEVLARTRLQAVVVLHANHPREIDAAVAAACERLRAGRVTLLNQSVLLRGVNDRVEALAELSQRLFAAGVMPYYVHLLDRVAGAAHFEVGEAEARSLMAGLHAALPGFLVPRLVREVPGAASKTPIDLHLGG